MANRLLRPCRYPGCGALTRNGWCSAHKPKQAARRESVAWHNWYGLSIWTDGLRPAQLLREPFCRECARRGFRVRATDVDHVQDHKGNWALFIDEGNLESLCHSCHSRKTMQEQWKKRRAKLRR
ncbi:HNH endonuclease [Colidextribacter sp. OB.20]|uniref:HNH endonuclease n=1 Tax=Colidextribacter sp. OB.20 TaxID=2304568 RepID=UPI0013688E8D|nr:HNH endonuclease [Colidextribacter sp. OB.20]NBI08636.1 HNH endonuclease [Colidextribacter sp. OB.20]